MGQIIINLKTFIIEIGKIDITVDMPTQFTKISVMELNKSNISKTLVIQELMLVIRIILVYRSFFYYIVSFWSLGHSSVILVMLVMTFIRVTPHKKEKEICRPKLSPQ